MENTSATPKRRGRPPRPAKDLLAAAPAEVVAEPVARPIERPDMRPAMREEDPRVAAARRAAEIRANYAEDDGVDEFKLPPAPDGWTYEWKAKSILGQVNHAHMTELYRMGWEEVPTQRHPEEMPLQGNHPVIERKGMVLMQRPTVIVEEARAMQLMKARSQVKFKEEQLNGPPEGGLGHRDHAQVKPKISKGYEPIPVPKD
jgi:hypothetical protein